MSIDEWNLALLDELLPKLEGQARTRVVLACDDDTVRAAGRRLELSPDVARRDLIAAVKVGMGINNHTQLRQATVVGATFERLPAPRPVPTFFSLLCLCVLAASEMGPDLGHSTHAYYHHLRGILSLPGEGEVDGFWYVEQMFPYLARWLAEDEAGTRGELILPVKPQPKFVGYPVSQTVFRERDREVLSNYFMDRLSKAGRGVDALRLLRRWSGRHHLTKHALAVLMDDQLNDLVRSAIVAAWRSWDGSVLIGGGRRVWPGTLRLELHPPRLLLSARNRDDLRLSGGGLRFTLFSGSEHELVWSLLSTVADNAVLFSAEGGNEDVRLSRVGSTVLFELREDDETGFAGLWRTTVVTTDRAWLLTRDADLAHRLRAYVDGTIELPRPWLALSSVPSDELPRDLVGEPGDDVRPLLSLEGGLPLEPGVYLTGGAPSLLAGAIDDDSSIPVTVDGRPLGSLRSERRLALPGSEPGIHKVVVGDGLYEREYELLQTNPHEPLYGLRVHQLSAKYVLQRGATTPRGTEAISVCGAVLVPPPPARIPIMRMSLNPVLTIMVDGRGVWHHHTPRPEWLCLPEIKGGARWEIDETDVLWVLCPRQQTATRWGSGLPMILDQAARETVLEMAQQATALQIGGRGDLDNGARQAWDAVVACAEVSS